MAVRVLPDQGWAWVTLAAASFIRFHAGLIYCMGVFNVIFLEVFDQPTHTTAWLTALLNIAYILGPVSGWLVGRWGARLTTVLGGLVCAFGYFLVFFSSSFWQVVISFAILPALGMSVSFISAVVVVGQNFRRYRNLAFGVSTCAVGISTTVFPHLINQLDITYGWRGCILLCSGITLHVVVCGVLLRPSQSPPPQYVHNKQHVPDAVPTDAAVDIMCEVNTTQLSKSESIEETIDVDDEKSSFLEHKLDANNERHNTTDSNSPPNSVHVSSSQLSVHTFEINQSPTVTDDTPKDDLSVLLQILIRNPEFYLVCLMAFMLYGGNQVLSIHFAAYMIHQGMDRSVAMHILTAAGLTSAIVRLIYGLIATRYPDKLLYLFTSTGFVTAVICCLIPHVSATWGALGAITIIYNIFSNCFNMLLAPVVIDLFSLAALQLTYGAAMCMCGLAGVLVPPLAGLLFDIFGTYDFSFYLAGMMWGCGNALLLIIPISRKYKESRKPKSK